MKNLKKRPPFDFVLEDLADIVTDIKPMFGAFGIYRDNQILMILRHKDDYVSDNGMWVGIPNEHILDLKKDIPELRDLQMFGASPTAWQVAGEDLPNFEDVCFQICTLIKKRDPRIGRTPKARLKKAISRKKKPLARPKKSSKNKKKVSRRK